jgi:hypothetical protein
MTELTDFLLARIADDENGTQPGTIQNGIFSGIMQHYGMDEADSDDQEQASEITSAVMDYLRPRVLAECEAKRQIVGWLSSIAQAHIGANGEFSHDADTALKLLASVYADHDDYQESWRP